MGIKDTIKKIRVAFYTIVIAIFFILLSGLLSRNTESVELYQYRNETGGGGAVAFVEVKEGFPINYVDNPQASLSYSPSWIRFSLNSLFWFCVSASLVALGQKKRK